MNELEKQRFTELNLVWKDDFKDVFESGNYKGLCLSPKHVKNDEIYVSFPLVRRMAPSRLEHSGTKTNGTIQNGNQVSTVVQVVCKNNLEDNYLVIGPRSLDEFKSTLIVRSGKNIYQRAGEVGVNICNLEERINELGNVCRNNINNEIGRKEFLSNYLEICKEFSDEIRYNEYLRDYSIFK